MAFDGIFTHYVVNELNSNLVNGRINKIYQVSNYELIFLIRANNKNQKLLVSIHPNYARCHITEEDYPYPQEPPMFCMLLRKHLEGGILTKITQKDNDRIIIFDIEHFNEIGDKDKKQLIVEIMGKHSNIILINQNDHIIYDSIKHISPFLNSYRTLQPGATYIYPPTHDKINFFQAKETDFETINYNESNLNKQLIHHFEGLSPLGAKELLYHAEVLNSVGLYQAYLQFKTKLNDLNPSIISTPKKNYFYMIPLEHLEGEIKSYPTLGNMLDRYYFNKDAQERIKQQTQDLEKYIKNEIEKNKNKLNHLETDLLTAQNAHEYELRGQLIIANLYQIKKGMSNINVLNYETNEEIQIELNPLLEPMENAQKYFTKYKKAKKAVHHLNEQLKLTHYEIDYFETLYEQMHSANLTDALEIRDELEDGGYLKRRHNKSKKKYKKPQYETFILSDAQILVGKNNIQNEYLTHKIANKTDYWMHVKDMPGSHVIIKCEHELTEEIIRTAANIAAYYSKGKNSSSVPIDYTLIRHVKKVPGAKPGYVTYDNQKTIYIDPDEDLIHALKKK